MLIWVGAVFKIISQYSRCTCKGKRCTRKPLCLIVLAGSVEKGASSVGNETCWEMPSPALLQK